MTFLMCCSLQRESIMISPPTIPANAATIKLSVSDNIKASFCLLTLQIKIRHPWAGWTCQRDKWFQPVSSFNQSVGEDEVVSSAAGADKHPRATTKKKLETKGSFVWNDVTWCLCYRNWIKWVNVTNFSGTDILFYSIFKVKCHSFENKPQWQKKVFAPIKTLPLDGFRHAVSKCDEEH